MLLIEKWNSGYDFLLKWDSLHDTGHPLQGTELQKKKEDKDEKQKRNLIRKNSKIFMLPIEKGDLRYYFFIKWDSLPARMDTHYMAYNVVTRKIRR